MTLFNVVHTVLAGIGVSSIIMIVPFAFNIVKFADVAYLVYLSILAWRVPATLALDPRLASGSGTLAATLCRVS